TPANADLCSNDDKGLVQDTARTLVAQCGDNKCEYVCKGGYKLKNGACTPLQEQLSNCQHGKPVQNCKCDPPLVNDNNICRDADKHTGEINNILRDKDKSVLQKIAAIAALLKAYFGF
ncbi:MAG: hypothetical protein AB1668_02595, partial [Nanoarchaeota archaeon]